MSFQLLQVPSSQYLSNLFLRTDFMFFRTDLDLVLCSTVNASLFILFGVIDYGKEHVTAKVKTGTSPTTAQQSPDLKIVKSLLPGILL